MLASADACARSVRLQLITHQAGRYHVSLDAVREFESAILRDPDVSPAAPPHALLADAAYAMWRLEHRLGTRSDAAAWLLRHGAAVPPQRYFAVSMGAQLRKCLPYFMRPGEKHLYIFDAWPASHDRVVHFCRAFDVTHAFFSAAQVVPMLQGRLPQTRCHWVPEGIDPAHYRCKPMDDRTIDVLALGRKYQKLHDRIVGPMQQLGHRYLYEPEPGQIIFPTREEFLDGLADSRISICVPASITHPDRAAGIETMTARYLQSMASRCLVVGHAPPEMVDLFGYNPVVELDGSDPAGQIHGLLRDIEAHQPLIERNHSAVLSLHGWNQRWGRILSLIAAHGSVQAELAGTRP